MLRWLKRTIWSFVSVDGTHYFLKEDNVVLEEILRAVAELTDEERQQLRQYIDQPPEKAPQLPPKERTQRLNAALDALGDGLDQAQLDEMTAAMTEEYIES